MCVPSPRRRLVSVKATAPVERIAAAMTSGRTRAPPARTCMPSDTVGSLEVSRVLEPNVGGL